MDILGCNGIPHKYVKQLDRPPLAIGDIAEFKGGHRGVYVGKYVMGYNISWDTDNINKVYYAPEFVTFYDALHATDLKLKWQRSSEVAP